MFIEPYLGTISVFAGNFAPRAWMFCQGQLLPISQYDALFALLGTTYGGDGQSTFALPDLRGRHAVAAGQGIGLSNYTLGEMGGVESTTLLSTQMPMHTHAAASVTFQQAASTNATSGVSSPAAAYPAAGAQLYASSADDSMGSPFSGMGTSSIAGSSQPVDIRSPYIAMNFVIAVEGIFPSRN
jgi:microcystin-dependent protein